MEELRHKVELCRVDEGPTPAILHDLFAQFNIATHIENRSAAVLSLFTLRLKNDPDGCP